ncbi:hypothetical protein BV25DRAFT_1829724 [Artomyces pyxidatus]|uniref:Uncharacterized protein n=1 Tax=Artomyces pyxidatus TaxID=48021 RepID=A0ACB8SQU8_9AGAM|nr:hypothetical protein BV25DRAFT_1829724 [Artomyces pyxidatus]
MGRVALEVELLTVTSMTKTTDTGTTTTSEVQVTEAIVEEKFTGFFIDTKPSPVVDESPAGEIVAHRVGGAAPPLGQSQNDDDDEDVIVYDAPHPRAGRLPSPPPPSAVPAPSFKDVSFSFASTPPTGKRIETNRMKHRRDARHAMFGSFGAIMSEAHLREEDPRRVEQRRGDSDVDWGDPSDGVEDPAVEELSSGLGGMDIDADLDIDAMKAFVKGMSASGSRHLSAGDLADEERMRAEDESQSENRSDRSSDDEGEMAVNADERMMVAELLDGDDDNEEEEEEEEEEDEDEEEGEGGDSDGEDSTDDDETPKRGFQARLERLRQRNKGKPVADMLEDELEDDDLDIWSDDDISAQVQKYLDENDDILRGFDRKNRKTFKAIHNGDFSGAFEFPSGPSNRRNDIEGVPMALRDQWSRDRAKKAEAKRKRAQARLEAAADPLAPKRGGTKGRKAMFAAAALDPDIPVPNRVFDAASLEAQIRRFIADIGGRDTMVLPPMAKGARKNVHELALAFGLSSQSKGKGSGRYPMLSKTTRTGFSVNERKVTRILRNMGVTSRGGPGAGGWGGKSGGSGMVAKPRDGEVVGKAAPKIGSSNVGFQMLAAMGWSQGDRIGITGGIEVPLTAIVKNTKLGLGAS